MTSTAPQLLPYLERLLDGETVEWKTLGDKEYISIENNARKPVNSMSRIPGNTPYYGANNIQDYVEGYTHDGVYVLIAEDGTASVEHYSIQWAEGKFWANNHVHVIKGTEKINNRFLYYFLKTVNYTPFLMGGGRAKLTKAKLQEIPFAVPSLRVQARIVEILDKFTQLEAELENELAKELEMRNKQYDFYRNRLLSGPLPHSPNMPHQWEQVPLGSVGEVRMCKRILKQDTTETGEIPFYKIGTFGKSADAFISCTLFEEYKQKYAYPRIGDILISASGTIGRAIEFDGQDAYFQDSNIVWLEHDDSKVLNRFLYYCYQIADWKVSKGGTIARLYNDNIKKTLIPLPPLSEQRRIVEILDRFDTLTNSISEGLPREIALRRKQYEYYRDALLRFPPPAPTA